MFDSALAEINVRWVETGLYDTSERTAGCEIIKALVLFLVCHRYLREKYPILPVFQRLDTGIGDRGVEPIR